MQSVIEHIKFQYPDAVYSKVFYQESAIVAGFSTVSFMYDKVGAIAILTLYIYFIPLINSETHLPTFGTITFTDQFNQILFRSASPGTGWAPLIQITEGQRLKIVSDSTNKFQIAHQYLMQPEKKA